jgi:hypothetical protein
MVDETERKMYLTVYHKRTKGVIPKIFLRTEHTINGGKESAFYVKKSNPKQDRGTKKVHMCSFVFCVCACRNKDLATDTRSTRRAVAGAFWRLFFKKLYHTLCTRNFQNENQRGPLLFEKFVPRTQTCRGQQTKMPREHSSTSNLPTAPSYHNARLLLTYSYYHTLFPTRTDELHR